MRSPPLSPCSLEAHVATTSPTPDGSGCPNRTTGPNDDQSALDPTCRHIRVARRQRRLQSRIARSCCVTPSGSAASSRPDPNFVDRAQGRRGEHDARRQPVDPTRPATTPPMRPMSARLPRSERSEPSRAGRVVALQQLYRTPHPQPYPSTRRRRTHLEGDPMSGPVAMRLGVG